MRTSAVLPFLLLAACGDEGNQRPDAGLRADARVSDAAVDATIDAAIDAPPDAAPDAPPDAPPPPSNATRVWAYGDFLVNNTNQAGAFVDSPTTPATLPFGPMAAPPLVPSATAVEVFDAAGGKIAYVVGGALFVANADGTNPVMVVAAGATAAVQITAVALSPNGQKVAFTRDLTIDNGYDLYVAPTTAGATAVKVSPDRAGTPATPADQDVNGNVTWSANSQYLAFTADLTANNVTQAYVVDTNAATPTAVELITRDEIATQTGAQGVSAAVQFDSANNLYFRARTVLNSTQFILYKATVAGAASRTVVALPARTDASVPDAGAFHVAGDTIYFSTDAPTLGAYDVYKQSLTATDPATRLTMLTGPGNPTFSAPMWLSPDGSKLAVVADFVSDGDNEPFVINTDGTGMRRLVDIPANCQDCDTVDLAWTVDGATLYAVGDLATGNDGKLWKLNAAMTDQTPTLAIDIPTSGDVFDVWAVPAP